MSAPRPLRKLHPWARLPWKTFPLHIVFILGYKCNLECTHCSSNASSGKTLGYSSLEAKRIIDQMADVGVVDVAFSGGEPLLRRDLEELIAYARAKGLTTGTSTNGYALTPKRAQQLRQAGLDRLQISVDGLQQAHDSIRGAGSFDKAMQAIEHSLQAGLRTHICFTAMRSNAHLLPEMIALAQTRKVHGFNLSQFVPTGRGAQDQGLPPSVAKTLLEIWMQEKQRHPDLYMSAHSSGLAALAPSEECTRGGCQAGISIGCITPEGDVTPCVMFPLSIGNLKQQSLREIWGDSAVIAKLHAREVEGVCGNCHYRQNCGGCRAAAWAHSGNMMAQDPYCWLVEQHQQPDQPQHTQQRIIPCLISSSIPRA